AASAPLGVHDLIAATVAGPPSVVGSPSAAPTSVGSGQPLVRRTVEVSVPMLHGGPAAAYWVNTMGSICVGGAVLALLIGICEFAVSCAFPHPVSWLVITRPSLNL